MTGNEISLKFDGKTHTFELTLGEIEELEDAFDRTIDEIDLNRTKAVLLLVSFAKRRENPGADPRRILDELRRQGIDVLQDNEPDTSPNGSARPTKPRKRAATAGG